MLESVTLALEGFSLAGEAVRMTVAHSDEPGGGDT